MKLFTTLFLLITSLNIQAQLSPAITSWLQNTTETGSYYVAGNSTAIDNGTLYNCQLIEYSNDYVYVHTNGIPSYPTGPFQDGNPSQAQSQDAIFRIPLNPVENNGTPIETNPGNIGVFINGVALFDWRDGVAWNPQTNSLCGGPPGGNPPCPGGPMAQMDWNRDAIPAEREGFDCSKAHPAMGNYHHHQNPSAFKLDLQVISDVCNLYDADGLYMIDSTKHSPLIGFAYDGFPIYGAYGFKNTDGTGDIALMNSSYQLRNMTERTHAVDGTDVPDGPNTSGEFFLGYFREDYEFIANSNPDYLDIHNGRFCVTPEYPNGTYAYFATVDENWNSTYPYVVGPTFFGQAENRSVNSIQETTTVYDGTTSIDDQILENLDINIYPNPSSNLVAVQIGQLVNQNINLDLIDEKGSIIMSTSINKGQSIAYFDIQTVYNGVYFIKFDYGSGIVTKKVIITR